MKLEVKNLQFRYGKGRDIFSDVSFTLEKGDILSILGANGAGKSTLLNCIAGLFRPAGGQILLDERSTAQMSRNEIAKHIGYVPQMHSPSFSFSVLEFTVMGRAPYIGAFSKPSKEDYEIAENSLERMGVIHLKDKVFTEMSGGEQQMVMLARVLTQEPQIIMFDEPTNHLDFGNQYKTIDMIGHLAAEEYTVIVTTHNPDHAIRLGGFAAVLDRNGRLLTGSAQESLTSEVLSKLYGIDIAVEYNKIAGRDLCFVKSQQ